MAKYEEIKDAKKKELRDRREAARIFLEDAMKEAAREALAERYILDATADFERNYQLTISDDLSTIDRHREVIDY